MPINGYLKLPDIDGESQRANHEDEIEISGVSWGLKVPGNIGQRAVARANVWAVGLEKIYDKSSPYLAFAGMRGQRFDEAVLSVEGGPDTPHDMLTMTLSNVRIKAYRMLDAEEDLTVRESFSLIFEKIAILYREMDGTEHEIEYDILQQA